MLNGVYRFKDLSGEEALPEAELIHRARKGDGTAWESLVKEHQTGVFRLAYLMLGNAAEAEDVAQEAFLRAFQALERFDAERPLRPWLFSITANLARNQRRSLGRYLAALGRFLQAEPEKIKSIETRISEKWEAESVWKAVRQLKDLDQQIIYLRYFLDIPVAETAQTLAIAEGTVKSRLHRALQRLQTVIEKEYPQLKEGRIR